MKSQADLIAANKAVQQAQGEVVAARVSLNTLIAASISLGTSPGP
jgi:hypothetical protein